MVVKRIRLRKALHARPAALFVRAAIDSGAFVMLGRPGAAPVDARSIVSVLGLDIRAGEEVELSAPEAVLGRLVAVLESP